MTAYKKQKQTQNMHAIAVEMLTLSVFNLNFSSF